MTVPALPGTLRDGLTVGMRVVADTDWLHGEYDPDLMRPRGGIVWAVDGDTVATIEVAVRGRPGGIAMDRIPVDNIHDCDDDHCLLRPTMARPADVRYAARWLLRTVAAGHGPIDDTERRYAAAATTLLTQGEL